MIGMAALLLIAASCKKDKITEIENAGSGFRATVESHEGTGKTHLEGLAVKWDSRDAILVKSSTCTTPRGFTTQESGDRVNFDADATLPTNFYAPPYTGYYPATAFSGDQLTLPATQNYVENTFASGANPMAAASSETLLPFKNVCGVLKLQLYSATPCQVQSISITSNNGEQLCGTGAVTLSGGIPSLGTLTGGGSTLTLAMGEGGKAMSTSESQPTAYYFVVPAGTLGTSFTVKVTETNGNVWSKTANAPANLIARSQITVLPEQSVATQPPILPTTVTLTAGCVECTYTVGGSVTVPEGSHNCEYGLVYCPTSAGHLPTVADSKIVVNTETFNGTKSFTADLGLLEVGVEYKVRAYAVIEGVAYSPESTVKTVTGGNVPLPLPTNWTSNGGKSPKLFTVGMDGDTPRKVRFSQGNLQYIGSAATPYWKFADHQFDFIGNGQNGSSASDIDRDLFGWGTSGYDNKYPYMTSTTYSDYGNGNNNISGTNYDWGVYNTIYAGTTPTSNWRTLTGGDSGEWDYLISNRPDAANLYGKGKVGNCTPGLIILPDDWKWEGDVAGFAASWIPGNTAWSNVYSCSDWAKMEAAGAVFLPAAGYREGTTVNSVGLSGYYWSSSCNPESSYGRHFGFNSGAVAPTNGSIFYRGFSVRLVSDN